jgi:hypothetical protein
VDWARDRRNDQRAVRSRPGLTQLRRLAVAEHDSGPHALGELPAVAPRSGVHLSLQLGAVHQRGYLEAEHERLDQHHDGERDDDVGRD